MQIDDPQLAADGAVDAGQEPPFFLEPVSDALREIVPWVGKDNFEGRDAHRRKNGARLLRGLANEGNPAVGQGADLHELMGRGLSVLHGATHAEQRATSEGYPELSRTRLTGCTGPATLEPGEMR